jgi:hypothetical protein
LSCLVLSCLVLSCLVLSCLVLSCFVMSCPVLSCLVLSCSASFHLMSCIADVLDALDEHGYAIVEGLVVVLVLSCRPSLVFLCPSPNRSPSP